MTEHPNRTMFARTTLAFALLLVAGCSINDGEINPVGLRVENASSLSFSEVTARFGPDQFAFGSVASGQATGYASFETVSGSGLVTVESGGQTYSVDQVGPESQGNLEQGEEYTLVLDIQGSELQATFRRD